MIVRLMRAALAGAGLILCAACSTARAPDEQASVYSVSNIPDETLSGAQALLEKAKPLASPTSKMRLTRAVIICFGLAAFPRP